MVKIAIANQIKKAPMGLFVKYYLKINIPKDHAQY